ncbi:cation-transporting P-type ATPase [Streptomyces hydrogenans]|uniref:cation-transporting P-type ATPase n=1 Tax=Streptomyces hydrogenans TaxID=1873719 RepID=UPI00341FA86B
MSTPTDTRAVPATPPTGLTATEASRRLAADGPGEVAARRPVRLYVPFLRTVLDTDPLRAA